MVSLLKKVYKKSFSILVALLMKISPKLATKFLYKRKTGLSLNLKNPKDFNEKIQWLKLYWNGPLVAKCGDKYTVREYVSNLNLSHILTNLHDVYEEVSEIDWDSLPQKFVLKISNGSGLNIICEDKGKINKKNIEDQLNKWLRTNFTLKTTEIHYAKMKPRIICEKFLETKDGSLPTDYKIFCFNGRPVYILVVTGRGSGVQKHMFDLDWNIIDFMKGNQNRSLEVPEQPNVLNDMVLYAEQLSSPFPFVRVDFYEYHGEAILGEMTFTPDAGFATHYNDDFLKHLGDLITLPQ